MDVSVFPAINASLNAANIVLLILGYFLIRQRAITAHTVCMIIASLNFSLFLAFSIYDYTHYGFAPFAGTGFVRWIYFILLISHVFITVLTVPLVIFTLIRVFKSQFYRHAIIARATMPVWLFVSATGVLVYVMGHGIK